MDNYWRYLMSVIHSGAYKIAILDLIKDRHLLQLNQMGQMVNVSGVIDEIYFIWRLLLTFSLI